MCFHHPKSSFLPSSWIWLPLFFSTFSTPLPSGNHHHYCLGQWVVLFLAFCFISHIWVKSYDSSCWLISHSMMFSRFTWQYFIFSYSWVVVYMVHIFFSNHLSNMFSYFGHCESCCNKHRGLYTSLQISLFKIWGLIIQRRECLGHMVAQFLLFWGTSVLFSIVVVPMYISTSSAGRFCSLPILSNICYFLSCW